MFSTVILSSLSTFTREFERCCREYSKLHIATASCGDPGRGDGLPFTHLQNFDGKIVATVGTTFAQTHPDGIKFLSALTTNLRIFKNNNLVFHPKVYLFSSAARAAVFVGSSNLTFSGFYKNAEVNV